MHFVLKAESESERDSWARGIERCISNGYSHLKKFTITISTPEF